MKIPLKDLKPNPFRNFDLYPIFPEWIEQLKDSIAHTGYWNGFLAREKDGQYEIPYGHHRKQALVELHGPDYQVEVQIEDMPDNLMRQRMFRENVRNEAQDSAVILHDIEVAKKFPNDWERLPIGNQAGEIWSSRPWRKDVYRIAKFIGRATRAVDRVWQASKTLNSEELSQVAPSTAEALAKEIRRQKPSPKARQQIIKEAKESNIGPKTAKRRVEEIILDEKVPLKRQKETPSVYLFMGEVESQMNKINPKLQALIDEIENINWENLLAITFVRSLDKLNENIQIIRRKFYEEKNR